MKVKYLGHSAVLIEDGNFKGLIDPFLSGNPVYIKDTHDIENISHIFITHGHRDHIGDSVNIALENGSTIVCNHEIGSILSNKFPKLKIHTMHIGGSFNFEFGKLKMLPAIHGSGITEPDGTILNGGNPCGFLIKIGDFVIHHCGDTGLTYDMKLLADENVDLSFIPIGGNFTMDIDDAVKAVNFINPKNIVPIHYNTFDIIKANPKNFFEKLPNFNVIIMNPGDCLDPQNL